MATYSAETTATTALSVALTILMHLRSKSLITDEDISAIKEAAANVHPEHRAGAKALLDEILKKR